MPQSSPLKVNYGALDSEELSESLDRSFHTDQAYYLPGSSQRNWKQCLVAAIPLLVAALVMGGAALYLVHDFGFLYPGGGRSQPEPYYHGGTTTTTTTTHANDKPVYDTKAKHVDSTVIRDNSTSFHGEAACSAHPKCSGLVGDCCPTPDEEVLWCCS